MAIGVLLLCFGCATTPPRTVTTPKQTPEPVTTPEQTPEPQPAAPSPEKTEPAKAPTEPVAPPKPIPEPRSTVPSPAQTDKPTPRAVASLGLTEQARLLIESKKPDDAISTLEKAMNLDPNNGRNYYFLAEAWMIKGNKTQAVQFNRMADLYLSNDAGWKLKVQQQKGRIDKMIITR